MLPNPQKPADAKKAYGVAQYSEKMTLEQFSEHIGEHNSVYDAEDVQAILGKAVKCLREMLLSGKKVELGKLGTFSLSLQGNGAETAAKYNPDTYVKKVNVVWTPGTKFENLKADATFNLVASRKAQKEAKKETKAQDDSASSSGSGSTQQSGQQSSSGSSQSSSSSDSSPSGSDSDYE